MRKKENMETYLSNLVTTNWVRILKLYIYTYPDTFLSDIFLENKNIDTQNKKMLDIVKTLDEKHPSCGLWNDFFFNDPK